MNTARLLSDILELNNALNTDGIIVTIDIETFILVFKTFAFEKDFLKWIYILSYVINGDITTSYFKMEERAGQGDLISVFLFIPVLEIVFIMISLIKMFKQKTFLITELTPSLQRSLIF